MVVQRFDAFQVISDPSRRQMLQLLTKDSMTINALAKNFNMSRPAVSKHIKIMYNAGFIAITDIGRERHCTLKQDGFNELWNFTNYFDNFWNSKLKRLETILNKNKMETQDYRATISVKSTAKEAFGKIANVGGWWAKDFTGKAEEPNDTFTVRFGDTFVDFKITEAVPDTKIVWRVDNSSLPWLSDKTEWNGTEIVFEIELKNNQTEINFRHIGLVPEIECYENCKKGWTRFITKSLPKFIDEGKGLPE